jgi:PAS domain S-box-containing protein
MLETKLDQATATAMQINQKLANRAMLARHGIIENQPAQLNLPTGEDDLPATAMAAPFLVQDRAIGAITLSRDSEPPFTREDLDLVTRFALQTGIAVENSRLYKQLERRLYRENLLNKLSRRLSSKLGLTDLAKDILTTAQTIARADLAGLVLGDPTDKSMYVSYLQDTSDLSVSRVAERPGMAMTSIREKRIMLTDDYEKEAYPEPRWIPQSVKGAISMPITIGDRVLGALGLFVLAGPFTQSDEILATLESIGWQTGVAIENALLFQQVNEYAHTLQEKVEERTAEIQKQKEQTDAILESAADAIFITSADGSIDYVNPAFSFLTGYVSEHVVGRSFEVLISGQTSTKKYQRRWNTILAGKTWRGDVKCKRYDDSLYDADLTIAPIFNIDGRIDKFVAIQRDISKKTELDRLKSEFLVTASHELRTPLTNVIGYTELLLNRSFSLEETRNFLRYIYDQSKYLANLVSDLLDVSKIESGTAVVVSPKLINPGHIFNEIVDYWQGNATTHDIHLEQPKMWPDIKADPDRLKQVLNNLLSNAVKYSPNGGKITVTIRLNPGNLHISVKDQGIGMTIDEQKHLLGEQPPSVNAPSV